MDTATGFLCPIYESTEFLCDRPAMHLIGATAICPVHAKRLGLTLDQLVAKIEEAKLKEIH